MGGGGTGGGGEVYMNLSWGDRALEEEVVLIARSKGVANRHFRCEITRCIHIPALAPAIFNPAALQAALGGAAQPQNKNMELLASTCHTLRMMGTCFHVFRLFIN